VPRKLTLNDLEKTANSKGGTCLAKVYNSAKTPITWECSQGHQWKASPDNVRNKNSWCPHCAGMAKNSIEDAKDLASKNKGKCLSNKYINNRRPLLWECSEGHQWESTFHCVQDLGSWCPHCAGNIRLTIEEMEELAIDRGGLCISTNYVNTSTKLRWQCSEGHKWEATPDNVKRGRWCPECYTSLGERLVRCVFEQVFDAKFPTSYPKWLKTKRNTQMELDGYNKSLGIAFEHQGEQHFSFTRIFHKDKAAFKKQVKRDKKKKALCNEHSVVLIEIPEIPSYTSISNLQNYALETLETSGINISNEMRAKEIDFLDAYVFSHSTKRLTLLRKKARKLGGKVLSSNYVHVHQKMKFECKKGHQWKSKPANILSGKWCRKCSGYAKLSIEDMVKTATKNEGECLSSVYVNSQTKLEWQCKEGHVWKAVPNSIRQGHWCPYCAGVKS